MEGFAHRGNSNESTDLKSPRGSLLTLFPTLFKLAKVDLQNHKVLLFDGVCNFCSATVQFIIRNDPKGVFQFLPIQSEEGGRIYLEHGFDPANGETFLLLTQKGVFKRSEAALEIARSFGGPWKLAGLFKLIPRAIRDMAYRIIAKNRYRIFGRQEKCLMPTPEIRARFL